MRLGKFQTFIVSLVLCFSAAALGSAFTNSQIATWYAHLHKASFNPPNWIFGPVWTLLYILMAISLYIIWTTKSGKRGIAQARHDGQLYFFVQLLFNCLWSLVFFGLHAPLAAFVVIVALWISIFLTIKKFWIVSTLAGKLLLPYILWVSFASILNLSVVLLN